MPEDRVGTVTHFFNHISVAIVLIEKAVKLGDKLRIRGAHDDINFKLDSMQIDHLDVGEAAKGKEVGMKVPSKAHEGSVVYRVIPGEPKAPRAPAKPAKARKAKARKAPARKPKPKAKPRKKAAKARKAPARKKARRPAKKPAKRRRR